MRFFRMTMLNRSAPEALPTPALTATEIAVLDRLMNNKPAQRKAPSHYLTKIARLGAISSAPTTPRPAAPSCGMGYRG